MGGPETSLIPGRDLRAIMKPLGRLGVAKRRRRAQPDVSFGWISQQMPIRQDADREQYLEGFRRAGLD